MLMENLCSLSNKQEFVIEKIYDYRGLTEDLILKVLKFEYEDTTIEDVKLLIIDLIEKNIVEEAPYRNDLAAYFLTGFGIKLYIRIAEVPKDIFDLEKRKVKRGYLTAGQLNMNPIYINHQMHNNEFMIEFQTQVDKDINYEFISEKDFAYSNVIIRPDSVIRLGNIDLYIETDMGTESSKQLIDKWENYREFLNSNKFLYSERRIIVLFALYGVKNFTTRTNLVKKTISDSLMDKLGNKFEIYVDTQENLLKCCQDKIFPLVSNGNITFDNLDELLWDKHNIVSTMGESVADYFSDSEYLSYSRMVDDNNKVETIDNRLQLYLFDDYLYQPLSVMSNLSFLERNDKCFRLKTKLKQSINLVIIVQNEETMLHDLKLFDMFEIKNVFLTTYDRLKNKPFYEALFTIDSNGNVFTFTNLGLSQTVFERQIV